MHPQDWKAYLGGSVDKDAQRTWAELVVSVRDGGHDREREGGPEKPWRAPLGSNFGWRTRLAHSTPESLRHYCTVPIQSEDMSLGSPGVFTSVGTVAVMI